MHCRFSAEPDDRVGRGGQTRGRGDRGGLNRRWGSERNTNFQGKSDICNIVRNIEYDRASI